MIGKIISHYKIIEKIGRGGMAIVYKARDLSLDREVVLKFLPPNLLTDEEVKSRFILEAKAAAALDHPNICTIYEINETLNKELYIAMAFYEGETLKEIIDKSPLDIGRAIDYAVQIADGLSHAHEKGIVHRDVKPANIIITLTGTAKILDFGLAKLAGASRITTTSSSIMGTVAYMSPEQASSSEVSEKTDIWALGVILYEMLTGKLPFDAPYQQAILWAILECDPESVMEIRSETPSMLVSIINKALQKNPDERYECMNTLRDDLKNLSGNLKFETAAPLVPSLLQKSSKKSIAVMPFTNMSAEKEQEYFCEGLSEDLINALTNIKDLKVVARTSSFSFKGTNTDLREIGKKLNISHLLEGSVRKAGEKLRITAQLINVSDGFHLWSHKYDRKIEDIFAVQDDITESIVSELKVELLDSERDVIKQAHITNKEAYEYYLRGRYYLANEKSSEGMGKAKSNFLKAIELEPEYSEAYSGLSDVYFDLGMHSYAPIIENLEKAEEAALKSIEINPQRAEGYSALAIVQLLKDWDFEQAEKNITKAINLNDNYSLAHHRYGFILIGMNRIQEAMAELRKTYELDPLSTFSLSFIGVVYMRSGNYKKALEEYEQYIEMTPDNLFGHLWRGVSLVLIGEHEKGLSVIEDVVEKRCQNLMATSTLGWAYGVSGYEEKAKEILKKMEKRSKKEYVLAYHFAKVHAGMNNAEKTFEYLDAAYEQRDPSLILIINDESFINLHNDERFPDLLKKLNILKYYESNVEEGK
jgi:serine/threonine protein kinase/Tfp pilus assembly protein PilF